MAGILPIPSTRVSDYLARQRLTQRIQTDQLDLFRLQQQISTGRRLLTPSDDAAAALRAINLQRSIERKEQLQVNVRGSDSLLSAADSSLSSVAGVLNRLRAEALGVVDTISTDTERQAVIEEIDRALSELTAVANTKFRDRYLFSGTRSVNVPYELGDGYVEYQGNEGELRSYVDFEYLFATNIPGTEVFGGISTQIRGLTDLDPQLHADTLLRDVAGGAGVSSGGAVEVIYTNTFGVTSSSVIDLSQAATVGDVARFLAVGAPSGSGLRAEVESSGIRLSIASGTFEIREVGSGRTADELGIQTAGPVTARSGDDISPAILSTTKLSDLLGRKATTTLRSAIANNDIRIIASENGASTAGGDPLTGVTVQFATGAVAGAEVATYNPATSTLTVTIQDGVTNARQVIAAINSEPSGRFLASIDSADATTPEEAGYGAVQLSATAVTTGGGGTNLDTTSGIVVTNNGQSRAISFAGAETVEDLLNALNSAGLGIDAAINADASGIDIRSRSSGADLTIGENGGTTATQLGIRSLHAGTYLSNLNRGRGVNETTGDDLSITVGDDPSIVGDGTSFSVDLSGAVTVGDVISRFNAAAGNTGLVTARLAQTGNGIELVNTSGLAGDLVVSRAGTSNAARDLGFVAADADSVRTAAITLQGEDRNTLEVDSIFNTLFRMRKALVDNDVPALSDEFDRLETDLDRLSFARSEIGARLQSLETLKIHLEDEEVQLRGSLSKELDVDLVQAISDFTARQYALQASLQTSASLLKQSLLDYI